MKSWSLGGSFSGGDSMAAVTPEPVTRLIEAFAQLPGIGPKTASRLTFYLLRRPAEQAEALADALRDLKQKIVFCGTCFNITEQSPCAVCRRRGPRPVDHLRGGGAAGRAGHRPHRRVPGAVPRPARRHLAGGGHWPRRAAHQRAAGAAQGRAASARCCWPPTPTWRARRRPCTWPARSSRWACA